ncbi:glycosyltransferase 87 family protein [Streptomyces sp. NPDC090022]|uniref:glycosyltransferase 87 family protein n=1 Tax=Streptomyces sp. NPDC090022 TaxID=3365920 RepID=UPI00381A7FFC
MLTHQVDRAHRAGNRGLLWCVGWLVAAGWAAAFPLVSTLDTHRFWGTCAAAGYLCSAAVAGLAWSRPWARTAALAFAVAGAVAVPFLSLVLTGGAQSEVAVIERSGSLLLQQATPYLAEPRTVVDVTPYLPGMALFGLPRALSGTDGALPRLLGDARLWCAAAFLACLWGGRRVLRGTTPRSTSAGEFPYGFAVGVVIASPAVALPLVVSGVDLPLVGLLCLALALAARHRPVAAGLALAAACSLKWTAAPAVAVAFALLRYGAGRRAAVRCALVALAGTAAAVLPSAVLSPRAMAEQVLAFPTGRGPFPTPASSPLPGRLLADLGPAGWYAAVALLLAGGLAVAVSLVVRPPRDLVAAADRLAAGLSLAFLLAPAGRFGYLALPVLLVLWARLACADERRRAPAGARGGSLRAALRRTGSVRAGSGRTDPVRAGSGHTGSGRAGAAGSGDRAPLLPAGGAR